MVFSSLAVARNACRLAAEASGCAAKARLSKPTMLVPVAANPANPATASIVRAARHPTVAGGLRRCGDTRCPDSQGNGRSTMSDSEELARDDCADGHDDEPEVPESDPDPDCSSFPQPRGCQNGVDRLACIAQGDKAKADYNETFAEKLQTAKADYALTQEAYRK